MPERYYQVRNRAGSCNILRQAHSGLDIGGHFVLQSGPLCTKLGRRVWTMQAAVGSAGETAYTYVNERCNACRHRLHHTLGGDCTRLEQEDKHEC